tara:strand:- start:750 stop:1961 length:1212 start_codon:yes stop_codon:yes gene_type:complete
MSTQTKSKIFFDKIHGYIKVDPLALSIIDTIEFQRLRFIKQTGILNYVFPTAEHTRFEHSIGTYYLSQLILNCLKVNQNEISITSSIEKVVTIAALCHDLGHVIFSHLFDDLFLKDSDNPLSIHENRSVFILSNIIKKYNIQISHDELTVIKDLINPSESNYDLWDEKFKKGKWIFEIVSNNYCHLDVDKFDYIVRDSNSIGLSYNIDYSRIIQQATILEGLDGKYHIHYPIQALDDIKEVFYTRYRLHKNIYNHKAVKGIEIYIIKILEELDKILNIREWICDQNKVLELLDPLIISNLNNPVIKFYYDKIIRREFPKLSQEFVDKEYFKEHVSQVGKNEIIMKFKIGLINKKENPLDLVPFYSVKDNKPKSVINTSIPQMMYGNKKISEEHLEFITRIYRD